MTRDKWSGWDFDYRPLRDQPLTAVDIIEDGAALRFTMADGATWTYDAEGDCCSHSWIEHLTVPPDIAGAVVTDFSEPELEPHAPVVAEEYDDIKVYHTAFATPKGEVIAEYRNSSNGYYGGWLSGPREKVPA